MTGSGPAGSSRYWWALIGITAILCMPVFAVHYPPLVDYPNHLARAYILYHYHDTPAFQQIYRLHFVPIPNLAVDIIIPLLLRCCSVLTAGRIFLLMTIVLFVAGCHELGIAAHGKPTWLALPCAFVVYCSEFLWGFLSFTFALGLFLLCVACWLKWRPHWTTTRLLLLTLMVCCTYFAHLMPYAFTSIAIGVMTIWYVAKGETALRHAALDLIPLVPPLLVFALYMQHGGNVGSVRWDTLKGKIAGLLSLILAYDRRVDILLLAGFFVIVLVVIRHGRSVRVFPPLFVAGLVFFILFLILPYGLLTGGGADTRFVPPAIVLFILSLKISPPPRTAAVLLASWLALSTIRIASIGYTWQAIDKRTSAAIALLNTLPEGARVYPAVCLVCENKFQRGLHHADLYAVVFRHAFVPSLLAIESQEILLLRQPKVYRAPGAEGWTRSVNDFDFVWEYIIPSNTEQDLERCCVMVGREGDFALRRVRKDDPLGPSAPAVTPPN